MLQISETINQTIMFLQTKAACLLASTPPN
jgi:hypothetical protein